MPIHWVLALVLVGTSVAAAIVAMLLMTWLPSGQRSSPASVFSPVDDETVFLFEDEKLIDATEAGRALLAQVSVAGVPWEQLCTYLASRFPGFETQIARLAERGHLVMVSNGPAQLTLTAEWRAGIARISLADPEAEGRTITLDRLSHAAMEQDLTGLRQTLEQVPVLVWRQALDGSLTWANRAYLDLAAMLSGEEKLKTWPLPRLFDAASDAQKCGNGASRRAKLLVPGEKKPRWFDCYCFDDKDSFLQFAVAADATVQAETALREFIQTLTKTFAHLPIGLAIFDRQRQMALFNPALIDLTGLGPEFLSGRPTLFSFLDRLREERRMPEPKDYKTWRQQMAALEKAASSGQYEQLWTLPSGQTYRVTGRPHPDGAMALLFEDISAEVSLTRRFRAELELGQAVIDALPEAIAVFSPAGTLVLSNTAYAGLWGNDPSTILGEIGIAEALRHWLAHSEPGAHWLVLRDYVGGPGDRTAWNGTARLKDGRKLAIRLAPVQGGSTLVGFSELAEVPEVAQIPRRTRASQALSEILASGQDMPEHLQSAPV